jgi:hypothetical protein
VSVSHHVQRLDYKGLTGLKGIRHWYHWAAAFGAGGVGGVIVAGKALAEMIGHLVRA